MIRTQEQVKKDLQTFDDIIVSLKKQLKYVELSRHEMTKQLTIPVVSKAFVCGCDKPEISWYGTDDNKKYFCFSCKEYAN